LQTQTGATGTVFTIGHSDHPPETLVRLLTEASIEVLVDVRSHPSSRWVAHANPHDLNRFLSSAGIRYLYLGDMLGGRPDSPDADSAEPITSKYEAIRNSKPFQEGLERLLRGLTARRVCIMCAEEDPSACHRNLLVGEALRRRGVRVLHIRGSGAVETDEHLRKRKAGVAPNQLEFPLGDAI